MYAPHCGERPAARYHDPRNPYTMHCLRRCRGDRPRQAASTRWRSPRPHAPRPGLCVPPRCRFRSTPVQGAAAARAGRTGGHLSACLRAHISAPPAGAGLTALATNAPTLLEVKGLRKQFPVTEASSRAACRRGEGRHGVDFKIRRGRRWVCRRNGWQDDDRPVHLLLERPTAQSSMTARPPRSSTSSSGAAAPHPSIFRIHTARSTAHEVGDIMPSR